MWWLLFGFVIVCLLLVYIVWTGMGFYPPRFK